MLRGPDLQEDGRADVALGVVVGVEVAVFGSQVVVVAPAGAGDANVRWVGLVAVVLLHQDLAQQAHLVAGCGGGSEMLAHRFDLPRRQAQILRLAREVHHRRRDHQLAGVLVERGGLPDHQGRYGLGSLEAQVAFLFFGDVEGGPGLAVFRVTGGGVGGGEAHCVTPSCSCLLGTECTGTPHRAGAGPGDRFGPERCAVRPVRCGQRLGRRVALRQSRGTPVGLLGLLPRPFAVVGCGRGPRACRGVMVFAGPARSVRLPVIRWCRGGTGRRRPRR